MERLWAPWRIRYIRGEREPGCFLCGKPQETNDAGNYILIRDRTCFAILNTFPYNPGHLMIAPYKHTGDLEDLSEQELTELMVLTRRCKRLLTAALKPEGFNVGINFGRVAGAGIEDHVHIHVVPRWNGDNNCMPVLSDVRVVPQALDETYAELIKHL